MTLDTRARRAAQGIHRAVEVMEMSLDTQTPRKVDRFDEYKNRKARNRRLAAAGVGIAVVLGVIVAGFGWLRKEPTPTGTPTGSAGRIVGTWRTPELTRAELMATTEAEGCLPAQISAFFDHYPATTLVTTLRIRANGTWQELQAIDDHKDREGSTGTWEEGDGRLVLTEDQGGSILLLYAIDGNQLSMTIAQAMCAENIAALFLFETSPFTRVTD